MRKVSDWHDPVICSEDPQIELRYEKDENLTTFSAEVSFVLGHIFIKQNIILIACMRDGICFSISWCISEKNKEVKRDITEMGEISAGLIRKDILCYDHSRKSDFKADYILNKSGLISVTGIKVNLDYCSDE